MISVSHKTKQFLVLIVKLLIVGGAFYFIYAHLANNDKLNWTKFTAIVRAKQSFWNISLILLLTFLNRFLEIIKWQNLVKVIKNITIGEASRQVLSALTLGLFTPYNLGEYAGKALFFEKDKTKKIVFLNLICNGIQMVVTTVFGIFGLLYFNAKYNVISNLWLFLIITIAFAVCLLPFAFKKITIKGYSIEKLIHKINKIPREIQQKNIWLGLARFLVFSHQYYFLFLIFDVQIPYLLLMAAITSIYFLASILPTFQFLDFAVKGSVAVFFFGLMGVNEWVVVFVTTLMWFLNTVLPVVIGSYFVLNHKTQWKS